VVPRRHHICTGTVYPTGYLLSRSPYRLRTRERPRACLSAQSRCVWSCREQSAASISQPPSASPRVHRSSRRRQPRVALTTRALYFMARLMSLHRMAPSELNTAGVTKGDCQLVAKGDTGCRPHRAGPLTTTRTLLAPAPVSRR
jgi:hypothetical protein